MATVDTAAEQPLFVRNATGLVRGWSAFDGFVYAYFACTVTSGLFIFSFGPFIPEGSLFWATVIGAAFIFFEVLVYAALIAAMPRAGGDYVWQTRILHGSIGFTLAATGWWFILWHWVPIYANIMVITILNPLLTLVGAEGIAGWFAGRDGIFTSSLIVIAVVVGYIALGMRGYAKIQKATFYLSTIGLAFIFVLLLAHGKSDFTSAFNREATDLYGANANAYDATLKIGGYDAPGPLAFDFSATFLLIPMIVFFQLWPNWGATLYGEVRGANDFRKNVLAMGAGLVLASTVMLVFIGLITKTMGWGWYNAANNAYWGTVYAYNPDGASAPLSAWPYPVMLASWLVDNPALQFILITLVGLLVLGWLGSVFLSSTRVVFAASFDRILPEWAAHVSPRSGVPTAALALMAGPSVIVAALYAYWGNFITYTLDATLVIAVTFLGTTIAAAVMPWRLKKIYRASPLAKWEWKGIPLITVVSFVFGSFLVFNLVLWLKDSVYGVNNRDSLIYMGILYGLAIAIYAVSRAVRARQGIALDRIHAEIPVE